jgi:hypothetical protein
VTPEIAERIVSIRGHVGRFSSAEEPVVTADLRPRPDRGDQGVRHLRAMTPEKSPTKIRLGGKHLFTPGD